MALTVIVQKRELRLDKRDADIVLLALQMYEGHFALELGDSEQRRLEQLKKLFGDKTNLEEKRIEQ